MEISGSLMLLELLISILCREAQHVYEEEIQNSIVRFIRRSGASQKEFFYSYEICIF